MLSAIPVRDRRSNQGFVFSQSIRQCWWSRRRSKWKLIVECAARGERSSRTHKTTEQRRYCPVTDRVGVYSRLADYLNGPDTTSSLGIVGSAASLPFKLIRDVITGSNPLDE